MVFSWVDMRATKYGDYIFPSWATAVGWGLSSISVIAIPIVIVIKVSRAKGPLKEVITTFIICNQKLNNSFVTIIN